LIPSLIFISFSDRMTFSFLSPRPFNNNIAQITKFFILSSCEGESGDQ